MGSTSEDRDLGIDRDITRRDFLNGVAVGIGALGSWSAADWVRAGLVPPGDDYPPAKLGMRGSHDGSFEVGHRLRDGARASSFGRPEAVDGRYDLVVVGAGISGLSAAHFFRERAGTAARVLLLDNHDDFGGHARRNEFTVGGRTLIGYGGSQSIDNPSTYSPVASQLLRDLAIDTKAFYKHFDQQYFDRLGLSWGTFFHKEEFGRDALVPQPESLGWPGFFQRTPLAPEAQRDLTRLYTEVRDYLPGRVEGEKLAYLAKVSYKDWLLKHVRVTPKAIPYLQAMTHDYFGVGIDAVPAGDCRGLGYPGFAGLGLGTRHGPREGLTARHSHDEPYIFHFPDGNASLARLLVRRLIPGVMDGRTMTDIVTARARYGALDQPANAVRLRLRSTAVQVRHLDPRGTGDVEVTYVRDGKAYKVTAARCILACWHGIIPRICPELPGEQRDALTYGVKVPLVYTNVAVRNWHALARLKVHAISAPAGYWTRTEVDFPVSMGDYRFAKGPDDPVVLFMMRTPCKPGLPARDQQRLGRAELVGTPWETCEREVRSQLGRMLGAGGFDPARDIAGITVNRWSHGYAYEYNSLWDPAWPPGQAPNELARRRRGNIAIANSDAAALAYANAAIDEAWRAVGELVGPPPPAPNAAPARPRAPARRSPRAS